jgi:serine/threonine-protein kinase
MADAHHRCDPGRIEQLLDGRLAADKQQELESHLEACATCRAQLETTAAEQKYWTDAPLHLRDDALDVEPGADWVSGLASADAQEPDDRAYVLRIADYFDPTDDPRMLGRFGGYEIVGVVGCGGMGVVLKGFETALDRYVAIKVLAPHLATSGAARSRFAREARAAAAVLHENVVAIHRVAEANGLPYLVMPYVPGDSLQKRLNEQGPFDVAEILRIGMQIAAGLAAAHAQGLVHRDIKPGNILLDKGVERVTITDFGLARAADDASLTRSGVIAGTPQYMSPEQARGESLDSRSDLFSLGSVLYALCVGRPPFRAETAFGVLQRISESQPTPIQQIAPETPDWLCEIIEKLHAKKPADRFQTAGEVADLLGRWLAHVQQPTIIPAPPHVRKRRQRMSRRRRIAALASIGIVCIGIACIYAAVAYWSPSPLGTRIRGEANVQSPSPAGRGARGEGNNQYASPPQSTLTATSETPTQQSQVASDAVPPHPNPLPAGEGTTMDRFPAAVGGVTILDDRALQSELQKVRERIVEIERAWSPAPSAVVDASWQSTLADLRKRADELSKRIENNLP